MTDSTTKTTASQTDPATNPGTSRFAQWLEKLKHVKGAIVALAGGGAVLSGLDDAE